MDFRGLGRFAEHLSDLKPNVLVWSANVVFQELGGNTFFEVLPMKQALLSLITTAFVVVSSISCASAACPERQQSQGGAELYVVSPSIRVRYEKNSGGTDIGLQFSPLGEEANRLVRSVGENSMIELVGRAASFNSTARSLVSRDVVRVVLVDDFVVIATPDSLIVRHGDGQITCARPNSEALDALISSFQAQGVKLRSSILKATSGDEFAAHLGI